MATHKKEKTKLITTDKSSFLLTFRNEKEVELFKQYKQVAMDCDMFVQDLIQDAMQSYTKLWKPTFKK